MPETESEIGAIRTRLESLMMEFDAVESFRLTDEERNRIRDQIAQCYETLGKLLDQLDRERP